MATELIAVGAAAADSGDILVAAGAPVTIYLKAAASGPVDSAARCTVQLKSVGGTYHQFAELTGNDPAAVLDAPGTFRVSRVNGSANFGVDRS